MIQEKWDELNKKYNELLDYILKDIDGMEFYDAYKVQIAQDQIEDIIAMHNEFKPFEIKVGKKYIAKFKTQLFVYENHDKENDIMDLIENDVVRVINVNKVYTTLKDVWNISTIIPTEQFKACFKPKEDKQ